MWPSRPTQSIHRTSPASPRSPSHPPGGRGRPRPLIPGRLSQGKNPAGDRGPIVAMIGSRREESLYRLPAARGARAAVGWRMAAWLMLGAADGGWLASSFMAWRLGYAARLGHPWLVRPWYPDRWLLAGFLTVAAAGAGMLLFAASRRGALLLVPVGVPLLLASLGPLYSPLRAIAWIQTYGRLPAVAAVAGTAGPPAPIGGVGVLPCSAAPATYGAWRLGRLQRVGDLHGSSHWA